MKDTIKTNSIFLIYKNNKVIRIIKMYFIIFYSINISKSKIIMFILELNPK